MADNDGTPGYGDVFQGNPSNWGKWGPDDEVGSLNYLGPEQIVAAAGLVRAGKVFTLQLQIGSPGGDPVWPGRPQAAHYMILDESDYVGGNAEPLPGGLHWADDAISMALQGSTQYDALGHVWYDGKLWNGYDAVTTFGGLSKASVNPIARRGVVGRGVLLDVARHRGVAALGAGETLDHTDLLACARAQGVELRPRDIIVIRTGWLERYFEVGPEAFFADFVEPGLTYSPELVRWFHDQEIPNLVTDTMGNETTRDPSHGLAMPLHVALMRDLGVAFTEICDLGELAADCAADGRYEFLYAAAPLKIVGATGSPVNPLAVK
jgi:kynurenine formamidase